MTRLITIFLILLSLDCLACTCSYQGNFLQVSAKSPVVVSGTVTQFFDIDSSYNNLPLRMEFSVTEIIKGQITSAKIVINGQDGINCLEWLNKFKIGGNYILALYIKQPKDSTKESTAYNLSGCGDYCIAMIDENTVSGVITKKRPHSFRKKLKRINEDINKAIDDENEAKEKAFRNIKKKLYDSLKETMAYKKLKDLFQWKLNRS